MAFSDFGIFLGDVSLFEINHFTKDPKKTQQSTLKKILFMNKNCEYGRRYNFADIHSIEDYQRMVPLSTYEDYAPYVDRMIRHKEKNLMFTGPNIRYCSSSGSVGKPKILPKSANDLWKMQCIGFSVSVATAAHWLKKHKNIKLPPQMGPLVLILTGHRLEDGKKCNGAGQIPLDYLKHITRFFCTSPVSLLLPEHEELIDTSYLQLRFALENEDVSYIGSMVVTLLTTMFDYLEEHWQMLCDDIEKGIINPSVKITPELYKKYSKKFNTPTHRPGNQELPGNELCQLDQPDALHRRQPSASQSYEEQPRASRIYQLHLQLRLRSGHHLRGRCNASCRRKDYHQTNG